MADPVSVEPLVDPTDAGVAVPPLGHHLLRRLAGALTYRDFRTLWLGAFISTVGTWMQKIAQNYLVFSLTGSVFYLGLDSFLGELPLFLFTLIGGVIADRHSRRHLLIGSQYVQMTTAFTLTTLVYLDVVSVWYILTLSFVAGCAQAFGGPAYQSLIPSLVPKENLPNAVALNSIQFNLARTVGPLLAGLTVAAFGYAACFGINGLSYLVVIVALLSIRVPHVPPAIRHRIVDELRSGLTYVRHEGALFPLTLLAFATTFLALPLLTFLPVFAQEIFHRDLDLYTQMMAFSATGAVLGGLVVAWLGRFKRMGLTLLVVQIGFGMVVVGFASSRILWIDLLLLFLGGAALMIIVSLSLSLVQLVAPNELRGRVMSIYLVAFRGGVPLGSLASASVASVTSAPLVLTVNGILLTLVACYFLVRSHGVREL